MVIILRRFLYFKIPLRVWSSILSVKDSYLDSVLTDSPFSNKFILSLFITWSRNDMILLSSQKGCYWGYLFHLSFQNTAFQIFSKVRQMAFDYLEHVFSYTAHVYLEYYYWYHKTFAIRHHYLWIPLLRVHVLEILYKLHLKSACKT